MIIHMNKNPAEEKFYSKKFHFSYSGLNKLLFSPKVFYKHYILQEREEKTDSHLIEGKVIHALLLDEKNFNNNFVVSPIKLPSIDTKSLIDRVFQHSKDTGCLGCQLMEHGGKILEHLKEIDLHQSLTDDKKAGKTGDKKRLEKIITDSNISYYEFLKTKEGKDLVDQETLAKCREISEILRNNPKISDLLKLVNTNKNITVLNEEKFEIDHPGYPFGLKGIVDNMVIDHDNKTIQINDLKTTAKTISEFEETVEYYNYWLQAAIYCYFAARLKPDYKISFTFIVIDKYQQVYPFGVSEVTMLSWLSMAKEAFDTAKWHYENKKYSLPLRFELENVVL